MATDLARKLRRNATHAEQDFWRLTWTWRQDGWPFRRQQLIGSYYVDFACLKAGLIIEIDGDTHGGEDAQANDAVRDDYLRGRGFTVMRFSHRDVISNSEGVFQVVSSYLDNLPATPPPQPSPQGGGSDIAFGALRGDNYQPNPLPLAGKAAVGGATRSTRNEDHQ